MTIEQITDHQARIKDRLPDWVESATQFLDLVDEIGIRIQGLEDELIKLLDERSLSTAAGQQLDRIGEILNLTREVGQTDDDYRADLFGFTAIFSESGQIEPVITVFKSLTLAAAIDSSEFYPAGFQITAFYDGDPQDPTQDASIVDAMNGVKAGGVDLDLRYAEETEYLEFSRASETDANGNGPSDALHGMGDRTLTEGGSLGRVIRGQ